MQWDMEGSEEKKEEYWRKFLFLGMFTEQLCLFVCHTFDIPNLAFLQCLGIQILVQMWTKISNYLLFFYQVFL